jgi:hypothetical protein
VSKFSFYYTRPTTLGHTRCVGRYGFPHNLGKDGARHTATSRDGKKLRLQRLRGVYAY